MIKIHQICHRVCEYIWRSLCHSNLRWAASVKFTRYGLWTRNHISVLKSWSLYGGSWDGSRFVQYPRRQQRFGTARCLRSASCSSTKYGFRIPGTDSSYIYRIAKGGLWVVTREKVCLSLTIFPKRDKQFLYALLHHWMLKCLKWSMQLKTKLIVEEHSLALLMSIFTRSSREGILQSRAVSGRDFRRARSFGVDVKDIWVIVVVLDKAGGSICMNGIVEGGIKEWSK